MQYITQQTLEVEQVGDVWIARLKSGSLDETWVERLGEDLCALIEMDGARKLVLEFSEMDCLYSMLMGKLVRLRRVMCQSGGRRIRLLGVSPLVRDVFRVCRLDQYFDFFTDRDMALEDW
jgi:anti-anti-sigma factor